MKEGSHDIHIVNLEVLLRRVVRKWKMEKKVVVPDSNNSIELNCAVSYGSALKRELCNGISSKKAARMESAMKAARIPMSKADRLSLP